MRLRILVLGEERAGKTSLIKKYRYLQADSPHLLEQVEGDKFALAYEPTVGLDFHRGHINGKRAPLRSFEGKVVRQVVSFSCVAFALSRCDMSRSLRFWTWEGRPRSSKCAPSSTKTTKVGGAFCCFHSAAPLSRLSGAGS
jgi:hypothetical protein